LLFEKKKQKTIFSFQSMPNLNFAKLINHNGHRESAYVMVNRSKTLPNTYLELVEYGTIYIQYSWLLQGMGH